MSESLKRLFLLLYIVVISLPHMAQPLGTGKNRRQASRLLPKTRTQRERAEMRAREAREGAEWLAKRRLMDKENKDKKQKENGTDTV